MTEIEHAELSKQEAAGNVMVGVDRVFARQFYTGTPIDLIERETGEAPYMEKAIVFTCYYGGPVLLVVSLMLSFVLFG